MVVGICVGETSLSEVTFISNKMPKVGEYVTIEYEGKKAGIDVVEFIHTLKCGALIEAAMMIGAVLAGATTAIVAKQLIPKIRKKS